MQYEHIVVPPHGQKITVNTDLSLKVPDKPIIPYIEGGWHRYRRDAGDAARRERCG